MKIEEEILQSNFRNKEEKLIVNFIYTYNWLKEFHMKLFKPYGLTTQQYNILRILRGSSPTPLSLKMIKERMLDKMSDASRLIERLKKKKLVSCFPNINDRRNLDIVLNKNGFKILDEIDAVLPALDSLFKNMSESEMEQINDFLDKLRSKS